MVLALAKYVSVVIAKNLTDFRFGPASGYIEKVNR